MTPAGAANSVLSGRSLELELVSELEDREEDKMPEERLDEDSKLEDRLLELDNDPEDTVEDELDALSIAPRDAELDIPDGKNAAQC